MSNQLVKLLWEESEDAVWTGPSGLFQRAAKEIERLRDALEDVRELIEGYVDVVDGSYGEPAPNKAMLAQQRIDEALS